VSAAVSCPRCGHADSFIPGFLEGTCVCRICQSQLAWYEIPGMGPDCRPLTEEDAESPAAGAEEAPESPPAAEAEAPESPAEATDA